LFHFILGHQEARSKKPKNEQAGLTTYHKYLMATLGSKSEKCSSHKKSDLTCVYEMQILLKLSVKKRKRRVGVGDESANHVNNTVMSKIST
jgi:hypothetical protein